MDFYGLSLEKSNTSGIIYHTIGVNGATYQQYNATPLFWEQLPALQADCYMLSMGTNEAQTAHLDKETFTAACRETISHLRQISPHAAIIVTTPAGSYTQGGKLNKVVGEVRNALAQVCETEKIAWWDLCSLSGGYAGAASWNRSNLISHDRIHYNAAGYQLQGQLLVEALARAYNSFLD